MKQKTRILTFLKKQIFFIKIQKRQIKNCGKAKIKLGYVKKIWTLKKNLYKYPGIYILQMIRDQKLSQKLIKCQVQILKKLNNILNTKIYFE